MNIFGVGTKMKSGLGEDVEVVDTFQDGDTGSITISTKYGDFQLHFGPSLWGWQLGGVRVPVVRVIPFGLVYLNSRYVLKASAIDFTFDGLWLGGEARLKGTGNGYNDRLISRNQRVLLKDVVRAGLTVLQGVKPDLDLITAMSDAEKAKLRYETQLRSFSATQEEYARALDTLAKLQEARMVTV